jgi:NitT/TauT family transport system substrate-binding protein
MRTSITPTEPVSRLARWLATAIAMLALTATIAACGSDDGGGDGGGGSEGGPTSIDFRLEWIHSGYHAPFYLALEEGLWEKRGLDVTIQEGSGSVDAVKSVIGKANPIVISDRSTAALSASQGADVLAVMGLVNKGALTFSCAADAGVESIEDVKGKTILTTLSGSDGSLLPSVLAANGIDEGDVTIQNVDPATKTGLLLAGKGDCSTFVSYVQPPIVEAQGFELTNVLWADNGLNILANGLITSKAWAEDNPDALKAFLAGAVEAYEMTVANPERAMDAYAKQFPQDDREVATAQLEASLDNINSDATEGKQTGFQAPEDWTTTIEALTEAGQIKDARPAEEYFTNDYLPSEG